MGDVAEQLEYGLNASATEYDGLNKYIRITDIDDKNRKFDKGAITSPNIELHSSDNYLLREGDILFARTGASVGKTYIYDINDGKVYYAGFLIRARINYSTDPEFVFQNTLTKKYYNFVRITSQRSGQPGINANEYKNYNISIPKIDEQYNISSFLKTIDDLVVLHQKIINMNKQIKKAYLNVMYPNKNENTPILRFNSFKKEWKQRKVEDIAIINTGNKDTKDAITNGDYDFYVRSPKIEKINSFSYDGEAVLTVGDGVGVGKVFHYVNGKFDYHQRVYKISDFKNYNGLFFYYYFYNNFKYEARKYNAKTSVDSVRREMITKVNFPDTSLNEQIQVGQLFKELDNIIELHQKKVNTLNKLKELYLRKMFL